MTTITTLGDVIKGSTPTVTATVTDGTDAIAGTSLDSLTLTLHTSPNFSVVGARSAQNVLNANDVTVDANGLLTWKMNPTDTSIVGTVKPGEVEIHVATFVWVWTDGNAVERTGKHEIEFRVKQTR